MRGDVNQLADLASAERDAWRSHAASHLPIHSPYYTPGFASAVEAVRGGVKVLVLGTGGEAAFLPFQIMPGRGAVLRAAEKVGGDMSDFFGLIGPPGRRLGSGELLRAAGLSAFHFDHLPEGLDSIEVGEVEQSQGFRLEIGDSAEAYFARLLGEDKHFAKQLARREKQLIAAMGELRFEWQSADPVAELDRLVGLKVDQYRRSNLGNPLGIEWKRRLLYHLTSQPAPDCVGLVASLWAGSTWIAAHLGLQFGSTLHSWFPVYNFEAAKFNPGHILFKQLIEKAPSNGVRAIDFGQGDSQYKRKYLSTPYVLRKGVLRDGGPRALADRIWLSAEWRLNDWRRRRAEPAVAAKVDGD